MKVKEFIGICKQTFIIPDPGGCYIKKNKSYKCRLEILNNGTLEAIFFVDEKGRGWNFWRDGDYEKYFYDNQELRKLKLQKIENK